MNKFWMVMRTIDGAHQPTIRRPEVKHFRMDDAIREAKRLAGLYPGEPFSVLEAVLSVQLPFEIERPKPKLVQGEVMGLAPAERER